ncbi:hypothetical protein H8S90_09925 [Olivibacter sp. SDN3]|uniref:hypothetical protein n=1 Tax=Olivibacter sp. SDN3 TaxID=2764720 RepID=UPI00165129B6|nr:hypothetical protein [Olivibacter sp. SDN3]QNL51859.1 hypothetical protein H8S90_09925 [Olivibacter sp. SDN3]
MINIDSASKESPLSARVLLGLRKAMRKLVEETAATGGSLVVKKDGVIKEVPAKELLGTLPKEE